MFRTLAVLCALSSPAAAATSDGATLQYTHFDAGVAGLQNEFTVNRGAVLVTDPTYAVSVRGNVIEVSVGRAFLPRPGDAFTITDIFDQLPDFTGAEIGDEPRSSTVPVFFSADEIRVDMGGYVDADREGVRITVNFAEIPAPVPLPVSMVLLLGGLGGRLGLRRRTKC